MTTADRGPIDVSAAELGDRLRELLPEGLFAFDVDGVLAPIVDHAGEARLSEGVGALLDSLAARTYLAIVSGRSLRDLDELFAFPPSAHVIGSHGLESRDDGPLFLSDDERRVLGRLAALAAEAVIGAGEGAWLERKPASVVLHTRLADPKYGQLAAEALTRVARKVDGAFVKPGNQVVELLARHTTKGEALLALSASADRAPIVFLGDDVTDEEAFAMFGPDDFSIRVGPGPSCARFRLPGPAAVVDLLRHLTA